ncbi:sodium:proton antiporter [Halobacteriales archaeon QS_4_69_225]|nr:MAG: sodium:proton antiporter [Halobacteriales archaeon QS_4_69_225]
MSEYGLLSLVPPLLAIALAIVTRKAVLSLFVGIWSGGIIATGGLGLQRAFEWIFYGIAGRDAEIFHVRILAFTLLLGSAVAMIWRLGGSRAVRNWAIERVQTKRGAGVAAWVLGLVLFFDDYANTAIVGSTMKDISDNVNISREKLSYLVDSTAAPVATLAISSWVAFQLGIIRGAYDGLGLSEEQTPGAFEVFLASIPYNMYAILAIAMVGIVVLSGRDYGEMLGAEHRAAETGKLTRDDAQPMQDVEAELGDQHTDDPRLASFVLPIVVLVSVTVGAALRSGGLSAVALLEALAGGRLGAVGDQLYAAVTGASYAPALVLGSFAMVATTYVLGYAYGTLSLSESVDTTIDGFGIMLTAAIILVLAWGIGNVVAPVENDSPVPGGLGTGEYVAGIVQDASLAAEILPVVVLFTAAFVAFSTGSAWSTMSIVTPVAIPVAWNLTESHTMVAVMVGMIFSGAIFGDHSSPISDTTVLSSTFTGADLVDHVRTQFYYAVTVAMVTAGLMLVWGFTRISPFVLLLAGVFALVGLVYGLSTLDARRRGIDPESTRTTGDVALSDD